MADTELIHNWLELELSSNALFGGSLARPLRESLALPLAYHCRVMALCALGVLQLVLDVNVHATI